MEGNIPGRDIGAGHGLCRKPAERLAGRNVKIFIINNLESPMRIAKRVSSTRSRSRPAAPYSYLQPDYNSFDFLMFIFAYGRGVWAAERLAAHQLAAGVACSATTSDSLLRGGSVSVPRNLLVVGNE